MTSASRIRARRLGGDVEAGREGMQRMQRRKAGAGLDIGQHDARRSARRARRGGPSPRVVRHAADHDQRIAARLEQRRCVCAQTPRGGSGGCGSWEPLERGQRRSAPAAFPPAAPHRGKRIRALAAPCVAMRYARDNGFERRGHRGWLVVPFGVVAHQRAEVARRVDPVDPRPALHGIHRPTRTEHQHRNAVAPGVEDRHRRVHEPDVACSATASGRPVTRA